MVFGAVWQNDVVDGGGDEMNYVHFGAEDNMRSGDNWTEIPNRSRGQRSLQRFIRFYAIYVIIH